MDTDGTVQRIIWIWYKQEPKTIEDLINGIDNCTQDGVHREISEEQKDILKSIFSEFDKNTQLSSIREIEVESDEPESNGEFSVYISPYGSSKYFNKIMKLINMYFEAEK